MEDKSEPSHVPRRSRRRRRRRGSAFKCSTPHERAIYVIRLERRLRGPSYRAKPERVRLRSDDEGRLLELKGIMNVLRRQGEKVESIADCEEYLLKQSYRHNKVRAEKALEHYNKEKCLDYELVKALGGVGIGITRSLFHVNFKAKPKNSSINPPAPDLFFAELCLSSSNEITCCCCTILEPGAPTVRGCHDCPAYMLHPARGFHIGCDDPLPLEEEEGSGSGSDSESRDDE